MSDLSGIPKTGDKANRILWNWRAQAGPQVRCIYNGGGASSEVLIEYPVQFYDHWLLVISSVIVKIFLFGPYMS